MAMGHRDSVALRDEPALASIRTRPEFSLLRLDLAFPVDVFARRGEVGLGDARGRGQK
jgi:hypothetical protein